MVMIRPTASSLHNGKGLDIDGEFGGLACLGIGR